MKLAGDEVKSLIVVIILVFVVVIAFMLRSADSASLAVLDRAIVVKSVITLLTAGGSHVPGGSVGTAAIYAESVKVTHIIREVMLRMDAWLNYLFTYWKITLARKYRLLFG